MPIPAPPPRHLFRWTLVTLGVLALPALIFIATRAVFQRIAPPPADTPATRKLRAIGHALHRYAEAHDGAYPKTLADLARDQGLPADLAAVPTDAPGGPYDFQYLGGRSSEQRVANGNVLVYDPLAANGGRGSHVLYADGSDAWIPADDLQAELDRSRSPGPPPE